MRQKKKSQKMQSQMTRFGSGDIPIEELMKLQNKISNQGKNTSTNKFDDFS
jgi:hypothetical protein